jgi:hypothetical protein
MHYFLEFLHRAFKTKNRLRMPKVLEMLLVHIDEVLFMIPGIKHLGWHWMIFAKKK